MIRTLERYALSSFDVLGSLPDEIATEILKEFEVKELLDLGLVSQIVFAFRRREELMVRSFFFPPRRSLRDGELSFGAPTCGDIILWLWQMEILCFRGNLIRKRIGEFFVASRPGPV